MSKVKHGEYGAFQVGNGLRFQFKNKLIKESSVPESVVQALKSQLGISVAQIVKPEKEEAKEVEEVITEVEVPETLVQEIETQLEDSPVSESLPDLEKELYDNEIEESSSIHGASLEDLARAMYDRFGVYTIFLNQFPQNNEISPISGEPMASYDRGVAYQAAKRSTSSMKDYVAIKARRESIKETIYGVAQVEGESSNDFNHRTSIKGGNTQAPTAGQIIHVKDPVTGVVHAERAPLEEAEEPQGSQNSARHPGEEELIVEPNLNGKPVIRPNW